MAQQVRTLTSSAVATTAPNHGSTPKARYERLSWEHREQQARVIESLCDSLGFDNQPIRLDYFSVTPGVGYRG